MIGRIAETLGGSLTLMDQINRMGTERIVALLERVVSALEAADKQMPTSPAPRSR